MRFWRFLPTAWWRPSAWKNWRGYVRWRLETYGVYYPHRQWNGRSFNLLLAQVPAYNRWLAEFDKTRITPLKTH